MSEHYLPKETGIKGFVDKLIEWFPQLADDRFRMLYQGFYEKWKYNREAEVSYRFWIWLKYNHLGEGLTCSEWDPIPHIKLPEGQSPAAIVGFFKQ